jgi:hypothetical protein
MDTQNQIPFTRAFVLNVTTRNMLRAIDHSIAKTTGRIQEFDGNSEVSTEILRTLHALQEIRKQVESITIPE